MPSLFIPGLTAALLSASPAWAQDLALQRIEARGASFPYVDAGEGEPVIFLHGSFADLHFWDGLREAVAEDHRFIAYTRRFYGAETWPPGPDGETGRVSQVEDLLALIRAWGGPAHLVGMGNSGQTALKAAEQEPGLVRSIVLFEPTLLPLLWGSSGPEGGAEVADAFEAAMDEALWPVGEGDPEKAMRQAYEFVFDLPPGGFDTLDPAFRRTVLGLAPYLAEEGGYPGPSLIACGVLKRVTAPTLVIFGSATRPAWSMGARAAVDCLPQGTLLEIEGAGHVWPIAEGAAFAAAALAFVDRN